MLLVVEMTCKVECLFLYLLLVGKRLEDEANHQQLQLFLLLVKLGLQLEMLKTLKASGDYPVCSLLGSNLPPFFVRSQALVGLVKNREVK